MPGIDSYRTKRYRVFLASSYFNMDLEHEVKWHKEHIKKLEHYRKNPHKFHRELTSHPVTQERMRHFKEQVVDALPFHNAILDQNRKRFEAITALIPKRTYRKLVRMSQKYGGTPEYFVYDNETKRFFFVAEKMNEERRLWREKTKKTAATLVLP